MIIAPPAARGAITATKHHSGLARFARNAGSPREAGSSGVAV